jgi:hypothetical protein
MFRIAIIRFPFVAAAGMAAAPAGTLGVMLLKVMTLPDTLVVTPTPAGGKAKAMFGAMVGQGKLSVSLEVRVTPPLQLLVVVTLAVTPVGAAPITAPVRVKVSVLLPATGDTAAPLTVI